VRVLIVDDEAPARARLKRLLAPFEDVQLAGEASDGAAALELVVRFTPDVLFLDVQMPELSGLDVAASLPDGGPAVVFVTAFDRYAIDAFDAQAVDYLLKPVDPARLARTVQRLRERRSTSRARAAPPAQLVIPDRGRMHVVRCEAVDWLEAADNYVIVHAGAQHWLMRRTLAGLLADLGEAFVRCHRSAAVALGHVTQLRSRDKGDATVLLRSGAQVACSRQYRAELVRRLASGSPPPAPG
jgi:two-component system, LytTR family, response regulator